MFKTLFFAPIEELLKTHLTSTFYFFKNTPKKKTYLFLRIENVNEYIFLGVVSRVIKQRAYPLSENGLLRLVSHKNE